MHLLYKWEIPLLEYSSTCKKKQVSMLAFFTARVMEIKSCRSCIRRYFVVMVKTPDQFSGTPVLMNSAQRAANTSEGPSPGRMRDAV